MQQAIETLIGGLLQGCSFALVALGFALVYRVTGTVNLAQGGFVVLGALMLNVFRQTLHWPLALSFVAGAVSVSLLGAVAGRFVFEPALRRLPLSGMVMLTAGLLTLIEGAILLIWGSQPYRFEPFGTSDPYQVFGVGIPTQAPWDVGATALIVLVLWYVLQKTKLGRALRACAENPPAARLMGIDVPQMTVLSFAVAGCIGAVSGMVIGPLVSMQFDSGTVFTTYGFIAVTIGGIASFVGPIVGGLGLGVIQQTAAGYVSSLFATTIALGLLLAVLIWRPSGIVPGRATGRADVADRHHAPIATSRRLPRAYALGLGAAALVCIALLPMALDAFGAPGLVSSFTIAGVLFIALLGLDVLMGYCGQVSLGHAAFVATGAYTTAICCTRFSLPPLVAATAGLAVSLASATVVSLVTVRLRGNYMALATMAFGLLIDSLIVGVSDLTGGPSGVTGIPNFSIGNFVVAGPLANYYFVWGSAIVVLVVLLSALRSDFGRTLRAIRTDQTAALALGIDVPRYKLYAFLVGAACASIAGSLLAFDFQFLSPDMVDTQQSILFVTMLVIGGEGTLVGPVIGVLLLTLLPTAFQALASYKTVASGLLLVLALLYLPAGLYGAFLAFIDFLSGRNRRKTAVIRPSAEAA